MTSILTVNASKSHSTEHQMHMIQKMSEFSHEARDQLKGLHDLLLQEYLCKILHWKTDK